MVGVLLVLALSLALVGYLYMVRPQLLHKADFPLGGTVEVYYQVDYRTGWLFGQGGLTYRIASDEGRFAGWLDGPLADDLVTDVQVSSQVVDPETIEIHDNGNRAWTARRDGKVETLRRP